MLIGAKACRNDVFHSERGDCLVLCLLKLKPHICTKKKAQCLLLQWSSALHSLSLQEEISGNVRQGTRFARWQLPLQAAVQRLNQHHPVVPPGAQHHTIAAPAPNALPLPMLNSDAAISSCSQMSESEWSFLQGQFLPLLPPGEASPKSQCTPPAPLCAILY